MTRRSRSLGAAVLVLVALAIGLVGPADGVAPASAAAASGPLPASSATNDEVAPDDEATPDDGASRAAASGGRPDRLARIARELRRTPFVVDPELDWMFDARDHRSIERTLRGARIPVFVAVLPAVDEDESGGDLERVVQRLQREVGRDGLYVAIDQDARMDLASVGVPLDLGISFSVLFPPRDERPYEQQERDPAPPPASTVPGRLREIVATVATAGPGTPNGVIDDVDELAALPGQARDERHREDAIAAVVMGVLLGLTLAGVALGVAHGVRRARSGGPGSDGPPGGGRRGGRAAAPARGARRGAGSGRRRRRGGPRA